MNEVVRRLAALAVAVGLVGGAVWIRARLDGGERPDAARPAGSPPPAAVDGPDRALRCPLDLVALCRSLLDAVGDDLAGEVVAEPAGTTLTTLSDPAGSLDGDVWLVPSAWPAMADDARVRAGGAARFAQLPPPVAATPLVVAVWQDRHDVLLEACSGTVTWTCIGDVAPGTWADVGGPAAWGVVKPAHGSPDDAVGLAVLAQAVADRVGTTTFSLRDLQDDAVRTWVAGLERAVQLPPPGTTALTTMVQFGPARTDLAATTEAEAATVLARAGERAGTVVLLDLAPAVDLDLVVAAEDPATGRAVAALLTDEAAAQVFADQGWRLDGEPPPARPDGPVRDAAPATPPGALTALRTTYGEVVR
ncbi:MAG: hypothetical protein ACLGIR_02610 [Actinomycetes bacterium]